MKVWFVVVLCFVAGIARAEVTVEKCASVAELARMAASARQNNVPLNTFLKGLESRDGTPDDGITTFFKKVAAKTYAMNVSPEQAQSEWLNACLEGVK